MGGKSFNLNLVTREMALERRGKGACGMKWKDIDGVFVCVFHGDSPEPCADCERNPANIEDEEGGQ